MGTALGYRLAPFTLNRRMAAASATVCKQRNTIHGLTEVDVTVPRRLMAAHREQTGETLSLTAYVVTSLAATIAEQPWLNAFRRGNRLVLLDDVTIGTLVERAIDDEKIPEPFGIAAAQRKSFWQIHDEIRAAQRQVDGRLGGLSGASWGRFIPSFLFELFIRLASRSIRMVRRYGAISVTSVGMFGHQASWFVPLSGSTVAIAVGSLVWRPVLVDGKVEPREHLCLTASFDHDVVDGAPAARFMRRFAEILQSGDALRSAREA
jgi:pyruvate/2-oxoglutarate dehydrogenase complex dihydrolipoamide acyltransferase (E2) component